MYLSSDSNLVRLLDQNRVRFGSEFLSNYILFSKVEATPPLDEEVTGGQRTREEPQIV